MYGVVWLVNNSTVAVYPNEMGKLCVFEWWNGISYVLTDTKLTKMAHSSVSTSRINSFPLVIALLNLAYIISLPYENRMVNWIDKTVHFM